MRHTRTGTAGPATLLMTTLLLAGCGGQDVTVGPATPAAGSSASGAAAASPAGPASSTGGPAGGSTTGTDAADTVSLGRMTLTFGSVVTRGAKEREVAEAWRRYWTERVRAFAVDAPADLSRLQQVAGGEALDEVVTDAKALRAAGHTLEGSFAFRVPSIEVRANRATVVGCLAADAREVDADGTVVQEQTSLPPQVTTFTATGGEWRATTVTTQSSDLCG